MERFVAVGRRKRSVARVYLSPGTGNISVNQRELGVYFPGAILKSKVLEPFNVLEIGNGQYDLKINVNGGGVTGQAEAVRLGVARALIDSNPEFRPPLKKAGLLTRDSRVVERKKYGKRKARKSSQFSKR